MAQETSVSLFTGHDDLRWSQFRHLPGDEMLAHVRDRVFPFIKLLGGESQPFAQAMQDAVFIIPKPSLLVEAVGIVDEIYGEIERERQANGQTFHDTQGDLYEYLLSEIATAGKNGQFRTPRHLIQMICALVDPKLGEEVCDLACGTGGFLLGAYQHILTQHTSPELRHTDENGLERGEIGDRLTDERQWRVLKERTFTGFDFDTTMVRIGLMNLLLHGIDTPNLHYMDTLSKRYDERDRYDVALANPPFKGSIDKGDINEDLSLATTKTELLFVNRIINVLRIGGRAGVIVPDGVLFGSSNAHKKPAHDAARELRAAGDRQDARRRLPAVRGRQHRRADLRQGREHRERVVLRHAVGRLLPRRQARQDRGQRHPRRGRPLARPRPAKDIDRTARSFFVPASEIKGNGYDLSINRYKEVHYEEQQYDPPKVILARLRALEDEIRKDLDELEGMLP